MKGLAGFGDGRKERRGNMLDHWEVIIQRLAEIEKKLNQLEKVVEGLEKTIGSEAGHISESK
jgi:hypothetical protein